MRLIRRLSLLALVAAALCLGCSSGNVNGTSDTVFEDLGDTSYGDAEVVFPDVFPDGGEWECETNLDCDGKFTDVDPCQIALCDSVQHVCVLGNRKDYTPCDDGDLCTLDTYCLEGTCGNGYGEFCDDQNPCTDDSCDPATGCVYANNTSSCDDGNECTGNDTCKDGLCVGEPGECPCTEDAECQPEIGDLCHYEEMACVDGFCAVVGQHDVLCDNALDTECVMNLCNPATGQCELTNVEGPCSDGSTCTVGDTCQDGVCLPGENMCQCETNEECVDFDDDNLCNGVLVCIGNQCVVDGASVVSCPQDTASQCQTNVCIPATGLCELVAKANGVWCDDGDVCTDFDQCLGGACSGTATQCDDGDPCTEDTCDAEGGCVYNPLSDVPCDDGDECTQGDTCQEGVCTPGENTCGECGDDVCEGPETCENCPEDCGVCPVDCGNGVCDDDETCENCPEDCGECPNPCGDGVCEGPETCENCPEDCGVCPVDCGNGVCDDDETCQNCPEDCGECAGDCCEAQEGPGCNDPEIMACVCEQDAYCCDTQWDEICVGQVEEFGCGVCETQGECGDGACDDNESCESCPEDCGECAGDCCEAQETPGCNDPEIMACVCEQDAFCCDVVWDELCVAQVEEFGCGDCGGVGGCGDGICDDIETCYSCPEDCGECAECGDGVCDELENCNACPEDCGECPYCGDGMCDENEDCKACPEDCGDCCGNGVCEGLFGEDCVTCEVDCGVCPLECGDGICGEDESCANCLVDCGECVGSCCVGNGTPGCQNLTVQACVCEMDPYCCEVEWDSTCAEEADDCGSCSGDCCAGNGTPGCDDEAVEACVCEQDAFCCTVAWDNLCAAEVMDFGCGECEVAPECGDATCDEGEDCKSCPEDCGQCCGNGACEALWDETCETCPEDCGECPVACGDGQCAQDENCVNCALDCGGCEGSCCVANGSIGCADKVVQSCVCAMDPYCCNNQWDSICAAEADECGSCTGDCCTANGTPGCDDEEVEACVCALDPYCCNVAWDNLCANEVTSEGCGDCTPEDVCGDGVCGEDENCNTCPGDCGECCGNEICEALYGETCETCPLDCGECPATCGDGSCDEGENCINCPADCGGCEGSCCVANGTVGCIDEDVQNCVCAMDAYCCNTQWDSVCAAEADDCGSCTGDCCAENGTPGCDDETIEACVCEQDPYCCDTEWDSMCADEVIDFGCGECVVPPECGDGECNGDETCDTCPEDCGECIVDCEPMYTLGCDDSDDWTTEDGSPVVNSYDCVGGDYTANEYIYSFTPSCTGPVNVTLTKDGDVQGFLDLFVLDGDVACNGTTCLTYDWMSGTDAALTFEAEAGHLYYIVVDGYNGAGGGYVINVDCECYVAPACGDGECNGDETCESCPEDCGECAAECGDGECNGDENCASCPGDCGSCVGSCCIANDTPGCIDADVQACVCAMDPYCCNSQWDSMCAAEADECGSCNGDCCAANGTPGCDDEDVEQCVCAQDSYCCNNQWDSLCADEVTEFGCGECAVAPECGDGECNGDETCETCPEDCGACPSDCCSSNGSPECEDEQCTNVVCAQDSYCCTTTWDNICAGEAADLCPVCGGTLPGGDCCESHAGTGCQDASCQEIVCAQDSYCCANSWDNICADEALDWCSSCGGVAPDFCGDGACNGGETCDSCAQDCGDCCGNGACEAQYGETCDSCAADCGDCCGNGVCEPQYGEDACNCGDCPNDPNACEPCECGGDGGNCYCDSVCIIEGDCCGNACDVCDQCYECGDGICSPGQENCNSCPADCGDCCGNGQCEADYGENCDTCEADCGACCGNGQCEAQYGEFCITCPEDCGDCPTNGNCCESNGSPGCGTESCTLAVCEVDSYCCTNTWDNICASEAEDLCFQCQPNSGSCCESNGSPGCDTVSCQDVVCIADPYCCNGTWDNICAGEAEDMCGDTCALWGGTCCESHDGTGCSNATIQDCVCAMDSYCCNNHWDSICVGEAIDQCGAVCE